MRKRIALFLILILCFTAIPVAAEPARALSAPISARRYAAAPTGESELGIDGIESLQELVWRAAEQTAASVDVSPYRVSMNDLDTLGDLVFEDPMAFHAEAIQVSYNPINGLITRLYIHYSETPERYAVMRAEAEAAANAMLADLRGAELSDLMKALLLHDRLAVHCAYDNENLLAGAVPAQSYTLYGALVNRSAVCDGYSRAYYYMLDQLGIESYRCSSEDLCHVWNIVKIDGEYYHVDVTWDDPVWDVPGRVMHQNFLRSTNGIIETGHTADDYDQTPNSTLYDTSYWQNTAAPFQLLNGEIYFIDMEQRALCVLRNGVPEVLTQQRITEYSYLSADERYLFFNSGSAIYCFDPRDSSLTEVLRPALPSRHQIYSFYVEDHHFVFTSSRSSVFQSDTVAKYQQSVPYALYELEEISVETPPAQTTYYLGDDADLSGLTLRLRYSDGSSEQIGEGFSWSGYQPTVAGKQTITVQYEGFTADIQVEVRPLTIALNRCNLILRESASAAFSATADPAVTVNWSFADPAVATVDNGTVLAMSAGRSAVRASFTYNGLTCVAECPVTVLAEGQEPAPGDVDGDGNLAMTDAILVLKQLADLLLSDEIAHSAADLDGSGVGMSDAILLLKVLAGLETLA